MEKKPKINTAAATPAQTLKLGELRNLVGYQVRRAHSHMRRDYLQTVGNLGFRPGQVSILVLIIENPGIFQIELSRELEIDKATVVALIDRLEKGGLVTRQRSTEDRRNQALFATREGIKMAKTLLEKTEQHEARYRAQFTEAELKQFLEYLQRIYQLENN